MYLSCALVRYAVRGTVTASVLGSHFRSRLLPVCSTSLKQFQVNPRRAMATGAPPEKEANWSSEDLEVKPEKPDIHPIDAENWTLIYRFKYINQLRLAVRLKLYQAVVGLLSFPAIPALNYCGLVLSEETVMLIMVLNLYVFIGALGVGHYAQKKVGILYINEPRDKVRVATLSFYGHRRDVMYDIQDIMTMSDQNISKDRGIIHFKRYSDPKDELFLVPNYATHDRELLEKVFGELPKVAPQRLIKDSSERKQSK